MEKKLKIVIVDDHELFVQGLRSLLASDAACEIAGVANSGNALFDLLEKQTADIILLDINMPGKDGLQVLEMLTVRYPRLKVIMLSTYSEGHMIKKAEAKGAFGYLVKNSSKEVLVNTIKEVAAGVKVFQHNKQTGTRLDEQDPFLKQVNLTKREIELLGLIKEGYTNARIAGTLYLSIHTVETHRKNIMHKLGLKNMAGLMKFIMEHNL